MIPTMEFGTVAGWVTAASTTTLVGTLIVAWWKRGLQLRGLDDQRASALQKHMDDELDRMQAVINDLRERLDQRDTQREEERNRHREEVELWEQRWREQAQRSEECERERQEMRRHITELEKLVAGLQAQIRAASTNRVLLMEQSCPPAPHSRAAAQRVKHIIEGEGK